MSVIWKICAAESLSGYQFCCSYIVRSTKKNRSLTINWYVVTSTSQKSRADTNSKVEVIFSKRRV